MILRSIVLQNFKSYTQQKFDFSSDVTVVIGPNTAGKTNLAEAIHLLATGKSFKGEDISLIHFGKEIGRVKAAVIETTEKFTETKMSVILGKHEVLTPESSFDFAQEKQDSDQARITLEVVLMSPQYNNGRFGKKHLVNDIPRSRTKFLGHLPLVLFRPEELDIIIDGPSIRRKFLDEVLEQVDNEYAVSLLYYERALRQRNALLNKAKETGIRNEEQFNYWDKLVIENGQKITQKREEFISWINQQQKEVIEFKITYDHSKISPERLLQYKDAEIGAGVTLVGPHRDDFFVEIYLEKGNLRDVKLYGSRGQQRLVVLQLKLLQIAFMTEKLEQKPLLVLDDIFSELDSKHIKLVLDKVSGQQAIITTTHREFIPEDKIKGYSVIELEK